MQLFMDLELARFLETLGTGPVGVVELFLKCMEDCVVYRGNKSKEEHEEVFGRIINTVGVETKSGFHAKKRDFYAEKRNFTRKNAISRLK